MALDKQVNIYSVDTGNFYSSHERRLHWRNARVRQERNYLSNRLKILGQEMKEYGYTERDLKYFKSGKIENATLLPGMYEYVREYVKLSRLIIHKRKKAYETKDQMLEIFKHKIEQNELTLGKDHIRVLDESTISEKKIISVFSSDLNRTIGIQQDELSEDIMTVQVYYFDVFKDMLRFGYLYKGEKYQFFSSSAGQIRTKKAVFIKESVWKQYENTLLCGLTRDMINERGGNNVNKYMAYTALTNSATDEWEDFDIDRTIVIEDFETLVPGTYDLIDDIDYSIHRITDDVPIPHTDGAGMVLSGKNRMFRAPWIKGLLGVFDFRSLVLERGWSPVIKDIYGKEHNIIAEDIQVIFTKSQFKMWKFYDSWDDYKDCFKKYGCHAGYCKAEEDRIGNSRINYQMLQTLTDITDEEVQYIAQKSINKINNLTSSVESVKDFFGVSIYNHDMSPLQRAVELYPNLLNDTYFKDKIRAAKDKRVKQGRAGKLDVEGKYTFILPDFYAACEHWFGEIENPQGLLRDKEVYCRLFPKRDKVDCLRSPHLYKEHAVRMNIAARTFQEDERRKEMDRWFDSNAVYTSCHDLITKILQCDVDGDVSLVIGDPKIVSIAERNMMGVVPLYYNMRKAQAEVLNEESLYNGLVKAFTGGNIGPYSNNISKIWNSEVFISGDVEERNEAVDLVKLLCMENNFTIDFAKTLYKPIRPEDIDVQIKKFTNRGLPHFFSYAKDKTDEQIEPVNGSMVNKLESIIPNPRLNFRKLKLGKINYRLLMHNPYIEKDERVIEKFNQLSQEYHFKINIQDDGLNNLPYIACDIRYEMGEFLQYGYTVQDLADMVVAELYGTNSRYKEALWFTYGELIVENLMVNLNPQKTKFVQCIDCGEWLEVPVSNHRTCRCKHCQDDLDREKQRKRMADKRKK